MLYRSRPQRQVCEIVEFIRKHDARHKAFGPGWTDGALALEIVRAAHAATFLLSENTSGEINGVCVGKSEGGQMHIVGIVTSERGVLREMIQYWKTNFLGWQLTGRRNGKMKHFDFETNEALMALCAKEAKRIVALEKARHPGCEGVMCGGDPPAPTAQESTADMLAAYQAYLPGLASATASQILPLAQAQQAANEAVNPRQAQLQADLYRQFGPQLNEIGNQIAQQNQLAQAGSDLATLQGPGNELIRQGLAAQKLVDPEFFAQRELTAQKNAELLNSINLNGLSGGERAEIERSLNRDNAGRGLSQPTATSTVANAMQFGSAMGNKRAQLAQALQGSNQFLQSSRSGIDPFQVATGRSSAMNTGEGKFTGMNNVGNQAFDMGQNMFNQIGENQRTAMNVNSQRRDSLDRTLEGFSAFKPNCCFNFIEALDGPLPWFVREERDRYYRTQPEVARGYIWMSRWLVPLMQRSRTVKDLVKELMVYPIIQRGGWLKSVEGYRHGWIYEPYKKFWFAVWAFCGKHFTR